MTIANKEVEVGDEIRFRWPAEFKKTQDERTWIVRGIPTNSPSSGIFWTFEGTRHGTIMSTSVEVSLEVLTP